MGFSDRLKQLRSEEELTQAELAEKLEMSINTLRQYEAGKREPNFQAVVKVEKFFNVTAAYLNGDVNEYDSSICHNVSDKEEALLTSFRRLFDDDQEEIMDIIELKLRRKEKKNKKINEKKKRRRERKK